MEQHPMYLTRKAVPKYFGNIISPGHLANLDSQGRGPTRMRMGNKTVYQWEDFIEWLENYYRKD